MKMFNLLLPVITSIKENDPLQPFIKNWSISLIEFNFNMDIINITLTIIFNICNKMFIITKIQVYINKIKLILSLISFIYNNEK